eukprot:CAMPEP_0172485388 /NCGR_PEP_ID=MMETSP1066-20121228/13454_1 /TAXON_ID=671091 /ORGANISM="Coscinodiscus wailesii, Strain CCMP2513" /LENGTH=399 /DNA_ID=CAMNT_0013250657 /DNA_START=312 /DNA_END=1511 /DNA_ORIENTATION=+
MPSSTSVRNIQCLCLGFLLASSIGLGLGLVGFNGVYMTTKIEHKNIYYNGNNGNGNDDTNGKYIPSSLEQYFMDNLNKLGYDSTRDPSTCNIWFDPNVTNPFVHADLIAYNRSLDNLNRAIEAFEPIPDLLKSMRYNQSHQHDICKQARLRHPTRTSRHGDGDRKTIDEFFPKNLLSHTPSSGLVEPLLPPMRHQNFCVSKSGYDLLRLDYLIHDFEAMCQQLKPFSRRVLIDMGASLSFHEGDQPMIVLMNWYKKFGFRFDHIYAFEKTFKSPEEVYKNLLPKEYMASYHWINVGVNHTQGNKLNPFNSILEKFEVDDFIVVKLDIDTSFIEVPLAHQLLEDKDGLYSGRIDQFYFEHHVHLGELRPSWGESMNGSIKDSFELFHGLRQKGIPAHFWP